LARAAVTVVAADQAALAVVVINTFGTDDAEASLVAGIATIAVVIVIAFLHVHAKTSIADLIIIAVASIRTRTTVATAANKTARTTLIGNALRSGDTRSILTDLTGVATAIVVALWLATDA
jgi:hypothetical protein